MSEPALLNPGDLLANRYRVEEAIGQGGFGAVFRATQMNLDRGVAVKVLHPGLVDSAGFIDRFRREAEMAQRLEHPNTVRLYDFGQHEGMLFLVFELLRGDALDNLLRQSGPLPPARVSRLLSQVLKSLMEAHSLQIVHRDIKPSNIFVTQFQGEPDYVKVLDFGIAKPANASDGTNLTSQGQMLGTPSYMAPEQVLGDAVGPWSDLYSLGLVMAEALTGDVVFQGTTAMRVCMAQASPDPAPIPAVVLSSPLGQIVARATQKVPANRYSSAQEMLEDLQAATTGMTVQAASAPIVASGYAPTDVDAPVVNPSTAYQATAASSAGTPAVGAHPSVPAPVAPQVATPAVAPHAHTPPIQAAPVPKKDSSMTLAVALVIGGGVVLAFAVVAILFMSVLVAEDDFGNDDVAFTPSVPIQADLSQLDPDTIEERIPKTGYALTHMPQINHAGGVEIAVFNVARMPLAGAVTLFRASDPFIATQYEQNLSLQPGVVARDGNTVLHVFINEPAESRRVFDVLVED